MRPIKMRPFVISFLSLVRFMCFRKNFGAKNSISFAKRLNLCEFCDILMCMFISYVKIISEENLENDPEIALGRDHCLH